MLTGAARHGGWSSHLLPSLHRKPPGTCSRNHSWPAPPFWVGRLYEPLSFRPTPLIADRTVAPMIVRREPQIGRHGVFQGDVERPSVCLPAETQCFVSPSPRAVLVQFLLHARASPNPRPGWPEARICGRPTPPPHEGLPGSSPGMVWFAGRRRWPLVLLGGLPRPACPARFPRSTRRCRRFLRWLGSGHPAPHGASRGGGPCHASGRGPWTPHSRGTAALVSCPASSARSSSSTTPCPANRPPAAKGPNARASWALSRPSVTMSGS